MDSPVRLPGFDPRQVARGARTTFKHEANFIEPVSRDRLTSARGRKLNMD